MIKISRPMMAGASLTLVLSAAGCVNANDVAGPGTGAGVASSQASANAGRPGWTGTTFVPGSSSSIAADAIATRQQQTGSYGRQR